MQDWSEARAAIGYNMQSDEPLIVHPSPACQALSAIAYILILQIFPEALGSVHVADRQSRPRYFFSLA
jgi:hypothetical protein